MTSPPAPANQARTIAPQSWNRSATRTPACSSTISRHPWRSPRPPSDQLGPGILAAARGSRGPSAWSSGSRRSSGRSSRPSCRSGRGAPGRAGRPSRRRRSAASTVADPWPISVLPQRTVTEPSAWTRSDRRRHGLRARVGRRDADRLAPPRLCRRVPAQRLGGEREIGAEVGIDAADLRPWPLPGPEHVAPPDLERIESQAGGRLVHLRLAGQGDLRGAEAPEGAGRGRVRVDGRTGHVEGRDPVRARRAGWLPCARPAVSSPRRHRCSATSPHAGRGCDRLRRRRWQRGPARRRRGW